MEEKQCTECGEKRTLDFYIKIKRYGGKLSAACRVCRNKRAETWRKANKEHDNELHRNQRMRNRELGLCPECSRPKLPNHILCDLHYCTAIARHAVGSQTIKAGQALLDKMIQQNYRCAYTNEFLELGTNCQLDHKNPASTHPHQKSDLDNLEWVLSDINIAKHNKTKNDFLALCKKICTYTNLHPIRGDYE